MNSKKKILSLYFPSYNAQIFIYIYSNDSYRTFHDNSVEESESYTYLSFFIRVCYPQLNTRNSILLPHTRRHSVIGLNPQVVKGRRNYSRVWNRKHSPRGSMIYGRQDRTAVTRISVHAPLLLSLHYITLAYLLFHTTTNKRDNLVCRATDGAHILRYIRL